MFSLGVTHPLLVSVSETRTGRDRNLGVTIKMGDHYQPMTRAKLTAGLAALIALGVPDDASISVNSFDLSSLYASWVERAPIPEPPLLRTVVESIGIAHDRALMAIDGECWIEAAYHQDVAKRCREWLQLVHVAGW